MDQAEVCLWELNLLHGSPERLRGNSRSVWMKCSLAFPDDAIWLCDSGTRPAKYDRKYYLHDKDNNHVSKLNDKNSIDN